MFKQTNEGRKNNLIKIKTLNQKLLAQNYAVKIC